MMTKYKAVPLAKMKYVYPSLTPMEILAVILVRNCFYYVVRTPDDLNYFPQMPKALRRHTLTADKVAYAQEDVPSQTLVLAIKSTLFKKKLIRYED